MEVLIYVVMVLGSIFSGFTLLISRLEPISKVVVTLVIWSLGIGIIGLFGLIQLVYKRRSIEP